MRSAEASDTLNDLSVAFADIGHYAEAEQAARRAADIRLSRDGMENPSTLVALYSRGHALFERGRWSEADVIFRQVLPVQEKLLGPAHPKVQLTRRQIARLAGLLGRYDEAAGELGTIVGQQRAADVGAVDAAYTLVQLASLRLLQGDLKAAEAAAVEAVSLFRSRFGEGHADVAWARSVLAEVQIEEGRLDAAAASLAAADAVQHGGDPADDFHARTEVSLGLVALRRGKADEARPHLGAAAPRTARRGGPRASPARAACWDRRSAGSDPARAEALLREALDTARRASLSGHPDVADAQVALALSSPPRVARPRPSRSCGRRSPSAARASPTRVHAWRRRRPGSPSPSRARPDRGGRRLVITARPRLAFPPARLRRPPSRRSAPPHRHPRARTARAGRRQHRDLRLDGDDAPAAQCHRQGASRVGRGLQVRDTVHIRPPDIERARAGRRSPPGPRGAAPRARRSPGCAPGRPG